MCSVVKLKNGQPALMLISVLPLLLFQDSGFQPRVCMLQGNLERFCIFKLLKTKAIFLQSNCWQLFSGCQMWRQSHQFLTFRKSNTSGGAFIKAMLGCWFIKTGRGLHLLKAQMNSTNAVIPPFSLVPVCDIQYTRMAMRLFVRKYVFALSNKRQISSLNISMAMITIHEGFV